ncbi:putative dihydroxyacetone synthase protein [Daldinia childiae]|uniref:putative dihydroxyacetone synthase protein n=1 Tax=Daldinia childiae TaxID=326645 RepID=UPI001447D34E|nr:putative dihydroxyacetone synthase protein [Daldinia childiae]KAF3059433.1 putative dihydroxyacetone synthase protein [Daldinia childiae]
MSSPSRGQLLGTVKLFIEAFNEFTPESVVRYRSPTCMHRLVPATLNSPPQSNTEYAGLIAALTTVMPTFHLRIVDGGEPVVDEVTRKVVLHLKSRSDTAVGLYENEYIWILTLSKDGKLVDDILEFADSLYTSDQLPKLKKAVEDAAKK